MMPSVVIYSCFTNIFMLTTICNKADRSIKPRCHKFPAFLMRRSTFCKNSTTFVIVPRISFDHSTHGEWAIWYIVLLTKVLSFSSSDWTLVCKNRFWMTVRLFRLSFDARVFVFYCVPSITSISDSVRKLKIEAKLCGSVLRCSSSIL
jgi:hypothetical protein